jgi:hypothetical protein
MAIEHGIQPHERSAYLRIDRAKGNNSRIKPPRWVTFVNQPLPQGDDVGVLIPWKPPALDGNSEVMEWAENVFLAILARFNAEGRRPSDRKGVNYGGRRSLGPPSWKGQCGACSSPSRSSWSMSQAGVRPCTSYALCRPVGEWWDSLGRVVGHSPPYPQQHLSDIAKEGSLRLPLGSPPLR